MTRASRVSTKGKPLSVEHKRKISLARGGGKISYDQGYMFRSGMVGHPLAVEGRVREHRRVLYDAIGPGPHRCVIKLRCTGWEDLYWGGHEGINVDHHDGDRLNNNLDNLRVSCPNCNSAIKHMKV